MKFTEEDLKKMLANGAKIASVTPAKNKGLIDQLKEKQKKEIKNNIIDLSKDVVLNKKNTKEKTNLETSEKKLKNTQKVKDGINKINKNCDISVIEKEDYCVLIFDGAKMLSLNQILALLQLPKKKFEAFTYKKLWHELTISAMNKLTKKYNFDDGCDILVYRSAPRLVDNDSLAVMFKFIIDAVKKDKNDSTKPYILTEDDPQFVKNIKSYQEKSKSYKVAIRFQKTKDKKKITFDDFCNITL